MIAQVAKKLNEKEKGFTLIELLVVVIIIGILAAIAIPVFMNQRQKAVDSSVQSDLRAVATEIESYWVDNQEYPAADVFDKDNKELDEKTLAISEGNKLDYAPSADGQSYTIVGTNDNGDKSKVGIKYDSAAGGIQK